MNPGQAVKERPQREVRTATDTLLDWHITTAVLSHTSDPVFQDTYHLIFHPTNVIAERGNP